MKPLVKSIFLVLSAALPGSLFCAQPSVCPAESAMIGKTGVHVITDSTGHEFIYLKAPWGRCGMFTIAPRATQSEKQIVLQSFRVTDSIANAHMMGEAPLVNKYSSSFDFADFLNPQSHYRIVAWEVNPETKEMKRTNISNHAVFTSSAGYSVCPWMPSRYTPFNMKHTLQGQQIAAGVAALLVAGGTAYVTYKIKKSRNRRKPVVPNIEINSDSDDESTPPPSPRPARQNTINLDTHSGWEQAKIGQYIDETKLTDFLDKLRGEISSLDNDRTMYTISPSTGTQSIIVGPDNKIIDIL